MEHSISVIIPAYNEESSIAQLLDALLAQTVPCSEIVIADAGSTDKTAEIIHHYVQRGHPIIYLTIGRAYPGKARNAAIKATRGTIIASIDAGCIPDRFWLERITAPIFNNTADCVWGGFIPYAKTYFQNIYKIVHIYPPTYDAGDCLVSSYSFVSFAMSTALFEKTGYFPEHLRAAEDVIFARHIKNIPGLRHYQEPRAYVTWYISATPSTFITKIFTYTYHMASAGINKRRFITLLIRYSSCALCAIYSVPLAGALLAGYLILKSLYLAYKHKAFHFMTPHSMITIMLVILCGETATISGFICASFMRRTPIISKE